MPPPLGVPLRLSLALLGLGLLGALTVHDVGVVGEVEASWALPRPPQVALAIEGGQVTLNDDRPLGPLRANQARPLERLQLGPVALPLAVNTYTGGPADWPARLIYGLSGSRSAVIALHLALGGLLIALLHRFLRFHGSIGAAPIAAMVLASDWSFVFYRKVLGGTELLLQAAGLLALWSFWSRRWSGGRHGTLAFAVAMGLGVLAKATFAATALALGIAILATRWDRPRLKAPPPPRWGLLLATPVLLCAPLWVTWLHHGLAMPEAPHVMSHDYLGLQVERALSGVRGLLEGRSAPSRESANTLAWFLLDPLPWFKQAYGATPPTTGARFWRLIGWGLLVGGTGLEWARRSNSPSGALLRFMSIYAPLQLGLLWLANRDLHHLAQATPTLAIWFGLAADRLSSVQAGARSPRRIVYSLLVAGPWILAGTLSLRGTDPTLATAKVPHFREAGQIELVDMLERNGVRRLLTSDYDLYGMLDLRAPELELVHTWGMVSQRFAQRDAALVDILRAAQGEHYLVVRPSARMIYNLSPSERTLLQAAAAADLGIERVEALEDADGPWAELWRVR
ncbi:MAG: hypothetical protein H6741_07405 [Alphaproteobacteria bacterium]|nr:hypothetical protein [Alphaproteobacteria bacterium]